MAKAPQTTDLAATDIDATRARLIEAAGEVFAEQGFQAATVREICTRAGANVAAVNYHFRDKMGLYDAVLTQSLGVAANDDARHLAEQCESPEQALEFMITGMLRRMSSTGPRGAWHVRIMAHEMVQPTAGLDRVIEQVIGPNYMLMRRILSGIVGLPPEHETTRLCAHSVVGQIIHYAHAKPVIQRLWPELSMTDARIDGIARHITTFSLAALRAIAHRENDVEETRR